MSPPVPTPLPERVRADLRAAMVERDRHRSRVLRTVLAALENAEAPPLTDHARGGDLPEPPVVGQLVEHRRLDLSADEHRDVIRAEIADRRDTARQFAAGGRPADADAVLAEIALLERYLD